MSIIYNGSADERLMNKVLPATIQALMEEDDKVCWLDADLAGCSGTRSNFGKNDRYINCGIAEANMAGIACGMASVGMKPYAHSFGPFASRRCYDQVFMSGAYAGNPITMIGTDPGITAAFNGGTHMPFEDTAIYRAIPNCTIWDVTDVPSIIAALRACKDMPGVKYIRTPRKATVTVYSDDHKFEVGRGNVVREGSDCVIVAAGIMVHEALQAAEALAKEGIECAVIDPFTIKPLDEELIRKYAEKCGRVVVAENHNKIGGLCSAVQEAIVGMPVKFGYVAVEDEIGEVGPLDYLRERFDLTDTHIARVVKSL